MTGWDSFEPILGPIEKFDVADLRGIASEIPVEWYGSDRKALSGLIEALCNRRAIVRSLIADFRDSPREPFLNWRSF